QEELLKKFKPLRRETNPFPEKIDLKGRVPNWMTPKLIAEVSFSEWTDTGKLRHAVFKALRTDKEIREIKRQKEVKLPPPNSTHTSSSGSTMEINGFSVPFSNLEKEYWPETGLRKYDLIDYYLHVAEVILPYLLDRPQNLHRHPNGINGKSFYQKDIDQ